MHKNSALGTELAHEKGNSWIVNGMIIATGVLTLSLLAQISIRLPFTPVPITGQTFGVALIGLLWGRTRGTATTLSYLVLSLLGAPLLAGGVALASVGPTSGYLLGMVISTFVVGSLADRGWGRTFSKALAASLIGSIFIFAAGLFVLSYFVGEKNVLALGLYPFLLGDLIKSSLAALIVSQMKRVKLDS